MFTIFNKSFNGSLYYRSKNKMTSMTFLSTVIKRKTIWDTKCQVKLWNLIGYQKNNRTAKYNWLNYSLSISHQQERSFRVIPSTFRKFQKMERLTLGVKIVMRYIPPLCGGISRAKTYEYDTKEFIRNNY